MPKIIDFKKIGQYGLVGEINRKVLHPLGLSLCYDVDSGVSAGAIIAEDYVWEYTPELEKEIDGKLSMFLKEREVILEEELKNGLDLLDKNP